MPVSPRPICLGGVFDALRTRLCRSAISVEPPARTYATASPGSDSAHSGRVTTASRDEQQPARGPVASAQSCGARREVVHVSWGWTIQTLGS